MKPKNKTTLLDILTGILAAVITFTLLSFFPFNIAFIIVAPIPVIAGFIRGKNLEESMLIKVALMNILFYILIAAIMNGVLHLLLILALGLIGTALGIYIRRAFSVSKIKVLIYSGLFSISIIYLGLLALPSYFDATMWREEIVAAPTYKFLSTQKDTIRSSDYSDKVVVMDFWATWCGPCKKQLPLMEKIYKNYKGNYKVSFLIINPCGQDSYEKALDFIKNNPYDLPFAMDIKSVSTKRLNVNSLPTIIIIDRKGVIRFKHYGYEVSENFHANICSKIDSLIDKN